MIFTTQAVQTNVFIF